MNYIITPRIVHWSLFGRNACMPVVILLLSKADAMGSVNISREWMGQVTGLSHITITAVLRDLCIHGIISMNGTEIQLLRLPDGIEFTSTTNLPNDQTTNLLNDQTTNLLNNQTTNHQNDQSPNLPISQPPKRPNDQSPKRPNDQSPKRPTKKFVKPTLEEVEAYISLKGYHFSAKGFVAHYESNGWKVGKNPMKSWKAACVTFEEHYKEYEKARNHGRSNNYQQQQYAARQAFVNAATQTNVCTDDDSALLLPGM